MGNIEETFSFFLFFLTPLELSSYFYCQWRQICPFVNMSLRSMQSGISCCSDTSKTLHKKVLKWKQNTGLNYENPGLTFETFSTYFDLGGNGLGPLRHFYCLGWHQHIHWFVLFHESKVDSCDTSCLGLGPAFHDIHIKKRNAGNILADVKQKHQDKLLTSSRGPGCRK